MKKILFILVAAYSIGLFAQTKSDKVDITYGDLLKGSKKETLDDIVARDEQGIICLKTSAKLMKKGLITLEQFNHKMQLTKTSIIDLTYNKKIRYYERFIDLDGRLFVFTSSLDKKAKTNNLYVQSINKQTLKLNADIQKIAEIDYSSKSKNNSGAFYVRYSNDSSKVLAYFDLPYSKNTPEKFGVEVFDNKMHQLWQKDISLPYEDKLFSLKDVLIDEQGNVLFLGRLFKDKAKTTVKGEVNYKYHLLIYTDEGAKLDKHDIVLKDKYITDMQIGISPKGNILCGGFYSNKGTSSIDGSYFLVFHGETKELIKESVEEFSMEFITEGMRAKEEKKTKKKDSKGKDAEMYEYDLDNFIMRDDGGGVLIGEQYWVNIVTTSYTDAQGNFRTRTTYHYYYNHIIVISISPEGDIEWTKKIIKYQHTTNESGYFSSYALAIVKDKLYFIFNDHPKNLMYEKGAKIWSYTRKKIMVSLVEIDGTGNKSKEVLFTSKDIETISVPKVSEQVSADELIIYNIKKKNNQFIKIKFKD